MRQNLNSAEEILAFCQGKSLKGFKDTQEGDFHTHTLTFTDGSSLECIVDYDGGYSEYTPGEGLTVEWIATS